MPVYLFECERCRGKKEVLQNFSGEAPICCGEPMNKLPTHPTTIKIKAAGGVSIHSPGYKEDYAKNYRRRLRESKS